MEERDASGDLVARYTYSPGYIDSVAVQERDLNSDSDFLDTGEVVYYHANTLASVYALSDAGENVVERYRYDAYGGVTVLDADSSPDADGLSDVDNPYTFTGRRVDVESGLMQYRHRYLSPASGRFISRDPVQYTNSYGLYAYVADYPTAFADPYGLRVVFVEIGLRESDPWPDLNVQDVQDKLNEYISVCNALLEKDAIKIVVRKVEEEAFERGWWYDRERLRMPWYSWVFQMPIAANITSGSYAYTRATRRPMSYSHWVMKHEKVRKLGGAYAYTHGAKTWVDAERFQRTVFALAGGGHTREWADLLAHEVLHLGLLGRSDDPFAEEGDISSRRNVASKPVKINEDWCCDLIDKLEVE